MEQPKSYQWGRRVCWLYVIDDNDNAVEPKALHIYKKGGAKAPQTKSVKRPE